jgi:hypothetical protein
VATVIQAVVGAPVRAVGGPVASAEAEPAVELTFGPVLAEEAPTDTPEWADLSARAQARFLAGRERVEHE